MTRTLLISTLTALAGNAFAAPTTASYSSPDRDRWNYPFNFSPGQRTAATTFGATVAGPGFDDRDATFVVGWNTDPVIPAGEPAGNYQITSVTLTAAISGGDQMYYDPTLDSYRAFLMDTDPEFVADADAGHSVEVFAVGYRNGFDLATWEEFSVWGGTPEVEPVQGARNVYPINWDNGVPFDVSNHVKGYSDATPAAIGIIAGLTPGALVPQDAVFEFELDLSDPDLVAYLQDSLALGRLNLVITSLHYASGGEGGGTGDPEYPAFYTQNDPIAPILGLEPTLEVVYEIGNPIDFNGDGIIDNGDIGAFVGLFIAGDPAADVNNDGVIDNGDIGAFVALFLAAAG